MLKTVAHASLVPLRGLLTRRVVLPRIEFSRAFRPEPREQPEQLSAYASEPLDTIVNAGVSRRRPKRLIPRDRLARRPQREGREPQPVRRRRSSISFRDVRGDRPDRPEKLLLRIRVRTGQSEFLHVFPDLLKQEQRFAIAVQPPQRITGNRRGLSRLPGQERSVVGVVCHAEQTDSRSARKHHRNVLAGAVRLPPHSSPVALDQIAPHASLGALRRPLTRRSSPVSSAAPRDPRSIAQDCRTPCTRRGPRRTGPSPSHVCTTDRRTATSGGRLAAGRSSRAGP